MVIRSKKISVIRLRVNVLQHDIDGSKCGLIAKCMEKVATERALRVIDKNSDHKVRFDGGSVKFNLKGYRWRAHTPKSAKTNLIAFDKERKARAKAEKAGIKFVSKVKPHSYTLEAEQLSRIQPMTRERMEQIYTARQKRIAEGRPDKRKYDLTYRVEGLGAV